MIKHQTIALIAAAVAVSAAAPAFAGPVGMGLHRTEEHSRVQAKARDEAKARQGEQTTAARDEKTERVCVAANTPPHRPSQPAQTCINR